MLLLDRQCWVTLLIALRILPKQSRHLFGTIRMGTSTDAHCFSCGYDVFLMLGGGMANHETYAAWPISCKDCAAITTANFRATPLICEKCDGQNVVPVTDRHEWKGDGKESTMWGVLRLTDGHYRCPKCGAFALRFGTDHSGHGHMSWD